MLRGMKSVPGIFLAALVMSLAGGRADAGLSKVERRVTAAVERRAPEALDLLERTVNVNSGTMNFDGVREVGRITGEAFENLGFTVRWSDGAEWGRAGHLIAEHQGAKGAPKVVLIGHLDTVFEKDTPFRRFEALNDSTVRGPGTSDMKGGNVVMWLSLRALADAGALDRAHVIAIFNGDEELAGEPVERARRDLVEAATGADAAIGFEGGDRTTGVVARRGSSEWTLVTSGKPSHSSAIFKPEVGSGAIYEAARVLTAFHDSLAGEPFLTFNPGLVLGGTEMTWDEAATRGNAFGKRNVVAESTVVLGDLRTLTPEQLARTQARMREIVSHHLPHTTAEIRFRDKYPPLAPTDANRRLLAFYDSASRDLGLGPVTEFDPGARGAADVSFTAGIAAAAFDGAGILGDGAHTVEETADPRSLTTQAQRFAVMLLRFAAEKR